MTHLKLSLVIGILVLLMSGACERQGPPKPIGSATNKHVEETPVAPSRRDAADVMIERMKNPIDDARRTEDQIKGAADRTRQQSDQANP